MSLSSLFFTLPQVSFRSVQIVRTGLFPCGLFPLSLSLTGKLVCLQVCSAPFLAHCQRVILHLPQYSFMSVSIASYINASALSWSVLSVSLVCSLVPLWSLCLPLSALVPPLFCTCSLVCYVLVCVCVCPCVLVLFIGLFPCSLCLVCSSSLFIPPLSGLFVCLAWPTLERS